MAEPQEPPIWVDELVARNEELLKAVAENQALGRLADAVAYQELFQAKRPEARDVLRPVERGARRAATRRWVAS